MHCSRKNNIILFIFLAYALFLSSCSSSIDTEISEVPVSSGQENTQVFEQRSSYYGGQMTLSFYFGDRTGAYSGSIDEAGLPDGQGSFHCEGLENNWTYDGELTGTFSDSGNGTGTYCDIDGFDYNATLSDGECQ